jgi:hypothetical protein
MTETAATTTGATPGAGATPAQVTTEVAGAGATPAAAAGTTSPAPATEPATGEEALGDSGKRILAEARRAAREADDRAKAAETERDALKAQTQSDAEKALEQARRDAAKERDTFWAQHVKQGKVETALTAAGIASEKGRGLAAQAPVFQILKVSDKGEVEKLTETVEQFKKDYPEMFGAGHSGWDGAEGGSSQPTAKTLEDAITAEIGKQFSRR